VSETDGLFTVAAQPDADRVGLRRILAVLCVTQVTSWGILYYAFPVLSGRISAATGWSPPTLTAAFSAGLVVSAVTGMAVGRWIDRHGPRGVMTLGSVAAVLAVVAIALAPSLPVFAGAWLVAGLAMAGVLYPPAFTALTRWYGPRRVAALTVLTLAGGFASTIFAPITAALATVLDWRGVYLVLAAVLAVVTIPAHAVCLRRPWPRADDVPATEQRPAHIMTSRPFVALAAALALAACASHAAVVNLVPLLTERGIGVGVAAIILGLGGAGQVLGRVGYAPLHRHLQVRSTTAAVLAGVAVSTILVVVLTGLAGLVAAVVLAGVMRGLLTLVQATAVSDRWGTAYYGRLTGVLSAPATLTAALAPWIGAALAAGLGGYTAMFWVMGAVAVAAAVVGLWSVPAPTSTGQPPLR
jgi:MFS family permease